MVRYNDDDVLDCDRVLASVGRTPNTGDLGLETVGIQPDARRKIPVDEGFRTTAPGIYAIGDIIAMLKAKLGR